MPPQHSTWQCLTQLLSPWGSRALGGPCSSVSPGCHPAVTCHFTLLLSSLPLLCCLLLSGLCAASV